MSNKPTPRSGLLESYCTVENCDGLAHYRIGTNDITGPKASFSRKMSTGLYCLAHARELAEAKRPAWEARRQAKATANREAHAAWKAQYDIKTESYDAATGRRIG